MKIKYLSESNPDYKCLEECISNGSFGIVNEQWLVEAERENKLGIESIKSQFGELFSKDEIDSAIEHVFSAMIEVPTKYDSFLQEYQFPHNKP